MFGWKQDIALLVVLQLVLGLAYLGTVPRIYVDEVWDSSLGYSLANTGSLKHPFVEGFGGMDIHFVQNRVVLPLVCAAVFKVAGYSITASRIGSVLFGGLAVVSLYAVMRRWFGRRQALFIGLATVIHPWFFQVSRRVRPEIYYIALALVFLWLMAIFFDSGSRRTAFFAGVLAGLSVLTHPNGLIIIFTIGCAVIIWQKARLLERLVPWAALGFTIAVLPYVIYVLWAVQNPQVSFAEQMQFGMLHRSFLSDEIGRWRSFLQWPRGAPLAAIMFVSWIVAWYRSSKAEKTLATIIVLFVLILPFTTINTTAQYLAAVTPFFSALVVRLLWRIMARRAVIWQSWYKSRFVIGTAVAFVYLSTCTVAVGLMFYHLRGADFTKVINHVASVVGPDSRVYGDPIFWLGHDRYKYGPYLMVHMREPVIVSEYYSWAFKHRFGYAVRTAWLLAPPMGFGRLRDVMPPFRENWIGDWLCYRFGTKIYEFYDPYYGPMEIYRLNWDNYYKIM